jgi:hypothetical protein
MRTAGLCTVIRRREGATSQIRRLAAIRPGGNYPTDGDLYPLRLCYEIKNFMQREAILSVDGRRS